MDNAITVTTAVKFRRWKAPNFATQDMPPGQRQDGFRELPSMPVKELPHQVLDALAAAWLDDLYGKTELENPFKALDRIKDQSHGG